MMLKIAYLGERFYGFVKQPGLRTVEGELLKAFGKLGLNPKIYPASRTDKGVSALCNVVKVDVEKDNICRMLTASLTEIWVYGYSIADWNPRHCTKHYIYFLPGTYDAELLEKCCTLFSGVHDFSAFTRAKDKDTTREIDVSFQVKGNVVLLHFVGKSFLWEMIRRCVTGMKDHLSGEKTAKELEHILSGEFTESKRRKVPPAPAENLLLANLVCDFPFFLDEFSVERMREEFFSRYELFSVRKTLLAEALSELENLKKEKK